MKQHEVVREVMREGGGYATLGQLCRAVVRRPEWQSQSLTPFASVRRIVQTTPGFFRIQPGLWGLEEERQNIGRQLALPQTAAPERLADFSHGYYQGLLVEIGNLKQFGTFVPAQDKNRTFLERRLADLATLPQFPDFTYPQVLSRARTVDVSWFNARRFPDAFFEVEHSTDISNSLLKFVELQDFRAQFWIVADGARRREYADKLSRVAFAPVHGAVKFLDYEALSDWHTKLSASTQVEDQVHSIL